MSTERKEAVTSKRQFVRLYKQGVFGNASPTWDTLSDLLRAGKQKGLLHLRNRITGGETFYNLTYRDTIQKWSRVSGQHNWYCSLMAPTEKTLLQGEVSRSERGLELTYTMVRKPMRDALADCTLHANGLTARNLLFQYLCPSSWDWLNYLLEAYVDHVVEFSVYSVNWGTILGHNTVFWEVRSY